MDDGKHRSIDFEAMHETELVFDDERFPRCGYMYFTLEGDVDVDAMARAVHLSTDVPLLNSLLKCEKRENRHLIYWEPRNDPPPEMSVEDLRDRDNGLDVREILARRFADDINRMIVLSQEPPVRTYLMRFDERLWALVFFTHHVMMAAGRLVGVLGDVLSAYHAEVAGGPPDWSGQPRLLPRKRIPGAGGRTKRGSYIRGKSSETLRNRLAPPARLEPDRKPDSGSKRTVARLILSESQFSKPYSTVKSHGATMTDLLVANSMLAIASWNRRFGHHARRIRVGVPVNLGPYFPEYEEAANHTAAVSIETFPEDRRQEPWVLLEAAKAQREQELLSGIFTKHPESVSKIVGMARRWPYERRAGILRRLMSQRWSLVLYNLGIIYPEVADGRPTGDSYIKRAGDLEVADFDVNFSVLSHIGNGIVAYIFRRRLHLLFSALRGQFSAEEARVFLEMFVESLDKFGNG